MAQGYVTKIDARTTKFGVYHDVYVDNKNLGGSKFPPKGIAAGDYVEYEIETNAKGYEQIKAGSLNKVSAPAGVTPPPAPTPVAASTIGIATQDVISRQAALNSAIGFLDVLEKAGALPDGKTLTPAKKADKYKAILLSLVSEFYHINTGSAYEIPEEVVGEVAANWDEQE
jgi:hypothetical protein